jgi:hypothetical protein
MNLLIILGVLFACLVILVPLIEKTAKPIDQEKMGQYSKIMMALMAVLIIASSIKFFVGS